MFAGMLAEVFVVNKDDEPFLAAHAPGRVLLHVFAVCALVLFIMQ